MAMLSGTRVKVILRGHVLNLNPKTNDFKTGSHQFLGCMAMLPNKRMGINLSNRF